MSNVVPFGAPSSAHRPLEQAGGPFADIDLIHSISVALIGEQDRVELYGKIVDAAITITQSQFGTMQLVVPRGDVSGHAGCLQLLCSRGLPPEAVQFWQIVSPAAHSSCTKALKTGSRAIIPDYEEWDEIAGTEDLEAFRRTGIRSAQTTPLLARDGRLLGMISTHWTEPHEPSARDLRLLDILARQAADLLERTIADEALRERKEELDRTCAALRESEQLQKMLTGELSHRVKNMLATVQAISTQTLRNCSDPAEFVESFSGRIQSMARVHSQLSTTDWKGTQLRAVVEDQMKLGHVDEPRIAASGPDIHLDANAVPKMAMILHELGTNARKYGALSRAGGTVDIRWTVRPEQLALSWTERGGPSVRAPVRRGFGSRLIEATVRGVHGNADMSLEAEGVRWEIQFPLPDDEGSAQEAGKGRAGQGSLAEQAGLAPSREPAWRNLAGKHVLVVEDEPLLALDIVGQLEDAGTIIVGPAADPRAALDLIAHHRIDVALLDANLSGEPVDDIAHALAAQSIPFLFMSGYGRENLPQAFPHIELLSKPFDPRQLLTLADRMLA
ncbi:MULTISPECIES: HWE histidine kinase domain-containing protein [Sphingobium]|jgi:two-component sensor histidine kinase|nr:MULTISPECIES: HWE histidine kinase domain-containing protein [Sphingobium]ATP21842.1 histidine kinase [Sphingobium yanoikuyae]KMW29245.1 histidine kinase [Sphingobium yanoikuyae]NBB40649.1 GAF domain-containing protein [Sphingobium yanoikuyae]QJR05939.1 GAF domain-containing protein [Sphingobium yanoikuyae]